MKKRIYIYRYWANLDNPNNFYEPVLIDETNDLLIDIGVVTEEIIALASRYYNTNFGDPQWASVKAAHNTLIECQEPLLCSDVYKTTRRGETIYYKGVFELNGYTIEKRVKEMVNEYEGYDIEVSYRVLSQNAL